MKFTNSHKGVFKDGKILTSYSRWKGIIDRVTSGKGGRDNSYHIATICDEWCEYSNFKRWFDENCKDESWQVDKDLKFFGNKEYSPDKCLMIPRSLNLALISVGGKNGFLPGVSFSQKRNKFRARCNDQITGKQSDKYFENEVDAFIWWREQKTNILLSICDKECAQHLKVYVERFMGKLGF